MMRVCLSIPLGLSVCLIGCDQKQPGNPPPPVPRFALPGQPTGNVLKGRVTCAGETVPTGTVILLNPKMSPCGFGKIQADGNYVINDVVEGEVYVLVNSDEYDPKAWMRRPAAAWFSRQGWAAGDWRHA